MKKEKKRTKKGPKTPTRTSPRNPQVSRRTGGAPQTTLEKLEEALAAGKNVDVNLSSDSDDVNKPDQEDVSDDEVSHKLYFCSQTLS